MPPLNAKRLPWLSDRARRVAAAVVLGACLLSCGGSPGGGGPPQPPILSAEADESSVVVTFGATRGASSYTLLWSTSPGVAANATRIPGVSSPYVHANLAAGQKYYYSVVARNEFGESTPAAEVVAEPGPMPAATEWTVVVARPGVNVVSWAPAANALEYRIYFSDQELDLSFRRPSVDSLLTTGTSVEHSVDSAARPVYYRVVSFNGTRVDRGGVVARTPAFSVVLNADLERRVRPVLIDIDADGCVDLVIARGDCTGRFVIGDLAAQGLANLYDADRIQNDSRIADYNGDGYLDIFSNGYAPADSGRSHAYLHLGKPDGTFATDAGIESSGIAGFGETNLTADFDNDGDLDLFVPHYWHAPDGGRSWLLINDGSGDFRDVAEHAGVARGPPTFVFYPYVPEGAQTLDVNQDGYLDFYVASHLFVSNGDLTYTDRREEYGLPVRFDEGINFLDHDLDGDMDFVHHDILVTRLHVNDNGRYDSEGIVLGGSDAVEGFGLNVCDVNGDGWPDVVASSNDRESSVGTPSLYINVAGEFHASTIGVDLDATNAVIGCADIDRNGVPDLAVNWNGYTTLLSAASSRRYLRVTMLDSEGRANQYGRLVQVRPLSAPSRIMSQLVDGGSGYSAQGEYALHFATPWPGDYEVTARYATGLVSTIVRAGFAVTLYPDGRVETLALPAKP